MLFFVGGCTRMPICMRRSTLLSKPPKSFFSLISHFCVCLFLHSSLYCHDIPSHFVFCPYSSQLHFFLHPFLIIFRLYHHYHVTHTTTILSPETRAIVQHSLNSNVNTSHFVKELKTHSKPQYTVLLLNEAKRVNIND